MDPVIVLLLPTQTALYIAVGFVFCLMGSYDVKVAIRLESGPVEGLHLNWVKSAPWLPWQAMKRQGLLETLLFQITFRMRHTQDSTAHTDQDPACYYYYLLCHYLLVPLLFIMPYPDVMHISCTVAPTATCTRAAAPLANLAGLYL